MHGYKINQDINLLVIKYVGETTIAQIAEMLGELIRDPHYSRSLNILSDLRELTSSYTYKEMHAVVDGFPDPGELVGTTKSAVVVSKEVTYGMGRIWASITEDKTVATAQVFRNMEEALEWLGLPPDVEIEFPF
jgi:hypothetical protein